MTHEIGFKTGGYVLWHGDEPIGICIIGPAALESSVRRKIFGRRFQAREVNRYFANVSRIVLDPRYRGCGLAAQFLAKACRLYAEEKQVRYIELLTSLGGINHFCRAAGFMFGGIVNQLESGRRAGGGRRAKTMKRRGNQMRVLYYFILDTRKTSTGGNSG